MLIFFGHKGVDTLSSAFGGHELYVECVSDSTAQCADANENTPSELQNGPYGTVPDTICWNSNCHEDQNLSHWAVSIFDGEGHVEASLIPEGVIAEGDSSVAPSGAVLMYSDFYNSYSDFDDDYFEELAKNSFAYLLNHSCAPPTVPEPAERMCKRNLVVTSLTASRDPFSPVVSNGTLLGQWLQGGDNVNHLGARMNSVTVLSNETLKGTQLVCVSFSVSCSTTVYRRRVHMELTINCRCLMWCSWW